jgi:hypothetical protein
MLSREKFEGQDVSVHPGRESGTSSADLRAAQSGFVPPSLGSCGGKRRVFKVKGTENLHSKAVIGVLWSLMGNLGTWKLDRAQSNSSIGFCTH